MNTLEKKMVDILIDLKENYHVSAVKAEFEAEGTRMEEALRLKEIVACAGLNLAIKIGGCEAIKDMLDAKSLGANIIIAPMIETPYAMKKYINATKSVFTEEERTDLKFFINIETITGYNNLDKMIQMEEFSELAGIVLGRDDMAGSMDLAKENIENDEMISIANSMAEKIVQTGKEFVIGGSVSANSLPFFKTLPQNTLTGFETRKIIFDAQSALKDSKIDEGIIKAIQFELMWLNNKRDFYRRIYEEDSQRLVILENRCNKLQEKTGEIYV